MDAPLPRPRPVAIVFGSPFFVNPPADLPTRQILPLIAERMRQEIERLMALAEQLLPK
jgi:1-acyl-sn-glycerol-3-phosphate acyltransferase